MCEWPALLVDSSKSKESSNGFGEVVERGNEIHERKVARVRETVIEIKRNREEEERVQRERESQELRDEVNKLKAMKIKLEHFVAARPDLQEKCSEALKEDPEGIDTLTPVSLDGVSEKTRLVIEKTNLSYDLDVRIRFILAHEELRDSFKEHVQQEGVLEIAWEML
jgi:hypothetical protein